MALRLERSLKQVKQTEMDSALHSAALLLCHIVQCFPVALLALDILSLNQLLEDANRSRKDRKKRWVTNQW